MKRFLTALPILSFLLLGAVFFIALNRGDPAYKADALVGRQAPTLELAPLNEGAPSIDAALLADGEAKLVNFWASWCAPCKIEHPELTAIAETGVPVIGVNYKDTEEGARDFLEALGDPYRTIGVDADGRGAIEWGLTGVPETYVVDGDGRIVEKFSGPLTPVIIRTVILPALEQAGS
ncbi:MAG: DsbE family thiol:disulfide interchange protein [Pseudomonadota bacterium]